MWRGLKHKKGQTVKEKGGKARRRIFLKHNTLRAEDPYGKQQLSAKRFCFSVPVTSVQGYGKKKKEKTIIQRPW